MSQHLGEDDLPALYKNADALAGRGQRRTKRYIRAELLLLIAAGATGVTTLRVGPARIDVLAVVGALAFVAALGITTMRALGRPEEDWYSGRAAAESVKTLAWRYAVGGDPFPVTATSPTAEERFLIRLRAILDQIHDAALGTAGEHDREITSRMRDLRAAPFADRHAAYREARISDQLAWYLRRADDHGRSARTWVAVAIGATVVGLLAASAKAVGFIDVDVLGLAASCATSAIGWTQTNQHRNLASAYRLTARELSILRDEPAPAEEAGWALFVSDAEDAMSREHTMWLARHGHPVEVRGR